MNLTHLAVSLVGRVDLNLSSGKESGKKRKEWDDQYDDGTGGGTILCQEQIVLCGSREGGRPLQPGVYEFGFELMFVPVGKMVGGLPSSLDVCFPLTYFVRTNTPRKIELCLETDAIAV